MKFMITNLTITPASSQIDLFQDMIDNPQNYKGRVIYIKQLQQIEGYAEWPDPFLWENKFYFNENGEWFESPFVKSELLE